MISKKIGKISIILLLLLIQSALTVKLASANKLKEEESKVCFLGTYETIIKLYNESIDTFKQSVDLSKITRGEELLKLSYDIGKTVGQIILDNQVNDEDIKALYVKYSSALNFLDFSESDFTSLFDEQKFQSLLIKIADYISSQHPDAPSMVLYLIRRVVNISFQVAKLDLISNKQACYEQSIYGVVIYSSEIENLNETRVAQQTITKKTLVLSEAEVRNRYGLKVVTLISRSKLEENDNSLSVIQFRNEFEGEVYLFKIRFVLEEKRIFAEISIGNQLERIEIVASCADIITFVIAVEKNFESYDLNVIIAQQNGNKRDTYITKLPKEYFEKSSITISSSEIVYGTYRIYEIRCSDSADEKIKNIIQVISTCTAELQSVIEEYLENCKPDEPCDYKDINGECYDCKLSKPIYKGECVDVCPTGTFMNNEKECVECVKCKTCLNESDCVTCEEGEKLYNQRCIKVCPDGTFAFDSEGNLVCDLCKNDCIKCPTLDKCDVCKNKYLLDNGECVDECVKGTFPIQEPKKCLPCPEECVECSSKKDCLVCKEGLVLIEGKCYEECPNTTFRNEKNECEPCKDNCELCKEASKCEECETGYFDDGKGNCINKCLDGYTRVGNTCLPCEDNCTKCLSNDRSICKECDEGYVLRNGDCVIVCENGEFVNEKNKCETCIDNCEICSDPKSCIKCEEGYFWYINQCITTCPDGTYRTESGCTVCEGNCNACNPTGDCVVCQPPLLKENGVCKEKCEVSEYRTSEECIPCTEDHCKKCDVNSNCIICEEGYKLKDGKCVEDCGDGYTTDLSICKPCDLTTCSECSTRDDCIKCKDGLVKINGICVLICPDGTFPVDGLFCAPCLPNCAICKSGESCEECKKEHIKFVDASGKVSCIEECPEKMYEDQKECKPCVDEKCKKCDGTPIDCSECKPEEYLYQGKCIKTCPDGTIPDEKNDTCIECDPHCLTCVERRDNCTSCPDPNMKVVDGECLYDCPTGKVRVGKECVECEILNCDVCNSDLTECIVCDEGFFKNDQGECIKYCEDGTRPNEITKSCEKCKDDCVKCPENSGDCTVCKEGFVKYEGKCRELCPDGTFRDETECKVCNDICKTCDNSTDCIVCEAGYLKREGKCVFQCESGEYVSDKKECLPCELNKCGECGYLGKICYQCEKPYVLDYETYTCVLECPDGSRVNSLKECEKCINDCKLCPENSSNCDECKEGLYLYKDECVICPSGTYPDGKTCEPCIENCKKCEDNTDCILCDDGYVLGFDNKCIKLCEDGSVPVDGKCERCIDTKCRKCANWDLNLCETCEEGTYYDKDLKTCVLVCEDGKYADPNTKNCEDCKIECKKCADAETCIVCNGELILNEDKQCIDTCPDGSVKINGKCETCQTGVECKKCSAEDTAACDVCKDKNYKLNDVCVEECPVGYIANPNKTCVKCEDNCLECPKDKSKCEVCDDGFIKQNGKCVVFCGEGYQEIDNECKTCPEDCKNCKEEECITCNPPLVLKEVDGKKECITVDECINGYFKDGTRCEPCNDPRCTGCSTEKNCFECEDGTWVEDGSKCVPVCKEGFGPYNGRCTPCTDPYCVGCNYVPQCDECKEGFFRFEGKCINECPPTYKHDKENKTCVPCEDNCDNCPKDPSKCIVCTGEYVLFEGKCVKTCEDGSIPINGECWKCPVDDCLDCYQETGNCVECLPPKKIHDGKCVEVCPDGTFKDEDKSCKPCVGCLTCENRDDCKTCEDPYILVNKKCIIPECKTGETRVNGKCVPCDVKKCKKCPNSKSCIECENGYFIKDEKCIPECLEGEYEKDGSCYPCTLNCGTCYEDSICDVCIPPYSLLEGKCVLNCPKGKVRINGKCVKCEVLNCNKCLVSDITQCDICNDGYKLVNGKCELICKEGQYVQNNGELGQECKPCLLDCERCLNANTCDRCKEGFVKQGEKCVKICKEGEVLVNGIECKKCESTRCRKCEESDQSHCIICESPFVNNNGKCVFRCEDGTFVDEENKCKKCLVEKCAKCSEETDCIICEKDYFLFQNKCIPICPEGYVSNSINECVPCKKNDCGKCIENNTEKCVICISGTYLFEGDCYEICPKGTYPTDSNGVPHKYGSDDIRRGKKCLPCDVTCERCEDNRSCVVCTPPSKLVNGKCITECKDGEAFENNKCVPCEDNDCLLCPNKKEICIRCKEDFKLINGKCIEECKDGYYEKNSICHPCDIKCKTCINEISCITCTEGFVLLNGQCLPECPLKFKKEGTFCEPCGDSKCIKCTAKDECLECSTGLLVDGECIEKCPPGTYYSEDLKTCCECKDNCEICSNKHTCEKCEEGFVKQNNECIEKCSDRYIDVNGECQPCEGGCKKCLVSDKDFCIECLKDQILYKGECIDVCPDGTYVTNDDKNKGLKTCKPCANLCKTCEDGKDCTSCLGNLILVDGKCVDQCKDGEIRINGVCKTCEDPSCKKCDNLNLSTCLECKDPKILLEGKCVTVCREGEFRNEVTKQCIPCEKNCKECNDDKCIVCESNTFPQENSEKCDFCQLPKQVIDGVCKSCVAEKCLVCVEGKVDECKVCVGDYVLVDGECKEKCEDGYYREGQSCKPCDEGCVKCTGEDDCDKCDKHLFLYNDKCIPKCEDGTVPNENNECVVCEDKENCIKCNIEDLSNCIICKGNTILHEGKCISKCPPESFYNEETKTCEKCPINCKVCDEDKCEECKGSFFLNEQGQCVTKCEEGFYEDPVTKKCIECLTENCSVCNTKECIVCVDPFKLTVDGECKSTCEDGTFEEKERKCKECDQKCELCSSLVDCEKCLPPFKLREGICVSGCKEGETEVEGKCVKCEDSDCKVCEVNHPGNCNECYDPKVLYKGVCIETCKDGTFPKDGKCEECNKLCKTCENGDDCITCLPEFVLVDGKCISDCPDGFTRKDDECLPCEEENCIKCTVKNNETSCLVCEEPYLLYDGKCITECPAGFMPNEKGTECVECQAGCSECRPEECTRCKKDYYLAHDGKCVNECYYSFVGNCNTRICDKCHSFCKSCKGPESVDCLECSNGFVFQGDKCVPETDCKEGFYPDKLIGECVECKQDNCLLCLSSQTCKECKGDYHSVNGQCVKNTTILPLELKPLLITPSCSLGEKVWTDSKIELSNTTSFSLLLKFKRLFLDSGRRKSTDVLLNVQSAQKGTSFILSITNDVLSLKARIENKEFVLEGPKLESYSEYYNLIISVTTDKGTISLNLSYNSEDDKQVRKYDKTYANTEFTQLIGEDGLVILTNSELCHTQHHLIADTFIVDGVVSSTIKEHFLTTSILIEEFTCQNKSKKNENCSEEVGHIILSDGFVSSNEPLKISNSINDSNVHNEFELQTLVFNPKEVKLEVNYDQKIIEDIVKVIFSDVTTPAITTDGNIELPSKDTQGKWTILDLYVSIDSDKIEYIVKVIVDGKVVIDSKLEDSSPNKSVLYSDASYVSTTSSNEVILLIGNSLPLKEILVKSIEEATNNSYCSSFDEYAKCVTCIDKFTINENGKCVNEQFNECLEVTGNFVLLNTETRDININKHYESYNIVVKGRKVAVSTDVFSVKPVEKKIISVRDETGLKTLVVESSKNGVLTYKLGGSTIDVNVKDIGKSLIIQLNYNKDDRVLSVFFFYGEQSIHTKVSNILPIVYVLGDSLQEQINLEVSFGLICQETFDVSQIIASETPASDALCLESDPTGRCLKCTNQLNSNGNCEEALSSIDYVTVEDKDIKTENSKKYQIDSENIIVTSSENYAVSASIKVGKYVEAEVLRLENEVISNTDNTPHHLFSILLENNQVIAVVDGKETPLKVVDTTEFKVVAVFDVDKETVTVVTSSKSQIETVQIPAINLQPLLEVGVLHVIDVERTAFLVGEVKEAILYYNIDESTFKPNDILLKPSSSFTENPSDIKGCEYVSKDGLCLQCSKGKELSDDQTKCLDTNILNAEKVGSFLINEGISGSTASTYSLSYPENFKTIGCHFKVNVINYTGTDKLFELKDISVSLLYLEGTLYLVINYGQTGRLEFGPYSYKELTDYVFLSFSSLDENKIQVTVRNSKTNAQLDSATIVSSLDLSEQQIIVYNSENRQSIGNCQLIQDTIGKPIIQSPDESKLTCDVVQDGNCLAGDFKLGEENTLISYIPNLKVIDNQAPVVVNIEELVQNSHLLCSRDYTLTFSVHILEKNLPKGVSYIPIATFKTGDNFYRVLINIHKKDHIAIERKDYFTTVKKQENTFEIILLDKVPESDTLGISVSVSKDMKFTIVVAENENNFIVKSFEIKDVQDCVTSNASIEFGSKLSESSSPILSIKNISVKLEESSNKRELYEDAIESIGFVQYACDVKKFGNECDSCKDGFKIIKDSNGTATCVVDNGKSYAFDVNDIIKVDETKPVVYTANLVSKTEISSIIVNFKLSPPSESESQNDEVPVLVVKTPSISILQVTTVGTTLVVENQISSSTVEIENVFDCKSGDNFANVVIELFFETGSTKVSVYHKSTDSIKSQVEFGTKHNSISETVITLKYGYDTNPYTFRIGSSVLSLNSDKNLTIDQIKLLSISTNKPQEQCRGELEDKFDICHKKFHSDITVLPGDSLFNTLESIAKLETQKEIGIYTVHLKINSRDIEKGSPVLFAIDNTVRRYVFENYKHNDIINEATEKSCRISILHIDNKIKVATSKREIEVSPVETTGHTKYDLILIVNTEQKTIEVRTIADDLTTKQVVVAEEVKPINADTKVYVNENVEASINLSNNPKLSDIIDCDSFKIENDNCGIDNCAGCIYAEAVQTRSTEKVPEKVCLRCNSGYNNIKNKGVCEKNLQVSSSKFIP